jgi:xylan 1,4-beta-xylosidase
MSRISRRQALITADVGVGALALERYSRAFAAASQGAPRWARGVENQRRADLGDGTFLNPILAGDHPTRRSCGTATTTT